MRHYNFTCSHDTSIHEAAESSRPDKNKRSHLHKSHHPHSLVPFLCPTHCTHSAAPKYTMASIARTNEDADKDSVPTAQKRKLPESFKLDGTKKFRRASKGRKAARKRAQELEELGLTPFHNPPWKKLCVPSKHPFFTKLPGELQREILFYLPLKDLSSIRRTSQQFQMAVRKFESDLTQPTITYHINRLKASIDAINATSMPTDAESLLACMRTWTSTRGSFRNPVLSLKSLSKWFSHLAGGELMAKEGEPEKDFQRWARLASLATQSQRGMNTQVANNRSVYDAQGVDQLWPIFSEEISKLDCPLSPPEVRKLYDRIKDARGDEIDIRGRWHTAKKERTTFPHDKPEKKTQADHYRAKRERNAGDNFHLYGSKATTTEKRDGRYRLTPIRSSLLAETYGGDGLRYPVRPAEILCASLGLPTLPDHSTFSYYVTKTWVFTKLWKSGKNGIEMKPVMRAAALEYVEIF